MSEPIITVVEGGRALAEEGAERFRDLAQEAIQDRGRFRVALSGGSTPIAMFGRLAAPPYRDQIDWGALDVFWSDERTVPPDHEECNFRQANEALVRLVPIPDENVHRMRGEATDPHEAARSYEETIRSVFATGPDETPAFDLILLGIGADGHTASLFPNTDALDERERLVVANAVPQLQTARLTMTVPLLNAARNVLVLVRGESKAKAVQQSIDGGWDPSETPAQLLRDADGRVEWLLDPPAAGLLNRALR